MSGRARIQPDGSYSDGTIRLAMNAHFHPIALLVWILVIAAFFAAATRVRSKLLRALFLAAGVLFLSISVWNTIVLILMMRR